MTSFGTVVLNDRSDFPGGKNETGSYAVKITRYEPKYLASGAPTSSKIEYEREYNRILGSKGVMASVKSFVAQFSGCPEAHKLRKRMIALARIHQTISGEEFRFPAGCP